MLKNYAQIVCYQHFVSCFKDVTEQMGHCDVL